MVEKLSHHRSAIPVLFDGVLEHLLVGISLGQYSRCSLSVVEFGIRQIVHSLDLYMPIFLKRASRQSCPALSLKFTTASFLGLYLYTPSGRS